MKATGKRRAVRARRGATFSSVLGELLLTTGVLVAGFVGWQLWMSDDILGGQQQAAASSVSEGFAGSSEARTVVTELRTDAPPVDATPADRESFAVMHIPRFGDFQRVIGEGTSRAVLDSLEQGLAHYSDSAMPGAVGNMAVAGHRNGQGGPFTHLDELRIGDRIYVQTASAWYVYEYRNSEYVAPTAIDVVAPVPQQPGAAPNDRLLTLTTCNPEWSAAGRLIAYATFVGWSPANEMPAELVSAEAA